ncbi:Alpha/Beta hydrolase protein [Leptodontidium sp. 2 PMI_412]|nr:Alpha/Beta hydrolase protein [Leptodontidium sp. MPI-SDFR-AT-0119]KAH9215445.1 Alpha/Beta hydrolase protein [Leptodontidium sp. 2 PMI_412]
MSCPDCFNGHVHSGEVKGIESQLHGIDTYVVEPDNTAEIKGLIVVVSDAFGWKTNNLRLLADTYAKRTGCRIYLPDFMNGKAAPQWMMSVIDQILTDHSFYSWVIKPYLVLQAVFAMVPFMISNNPKSAYKTIEKYMSDIRCAEGNNLKIGAIGFCWGGYSVTRLAHGGRAANGKRLIDAAFTAHPSELSLPEDIKKIKLPYGVVIGDVDFAMSLQKVREMEDILSEKTGVDSEVTVIPNAKHGFAVRGNPDDQVAMEMADQAEDLAVKWFAKCLK